MPELVLPRYRAFMSYSRKDRAFGESLHRWLENYSVPPELVGKPTPYGTVPQKLRPIFRDRYDLEAGGLLKDQIVESLQSSESLIVVCSPSAAKSKYVNEEIRGFKTLGKSGRIYPIIVDGEPGDPERDCFPPALRTIIGPDGQPTGQPEEHIAADARPEGDGLELARLKLVAGLLGVDLDELRKREAHEERKRKIFWRRLSGAMAALAIAAAGAAAWGWIERGLKQTALVAETKALGEKTLALEKSDSLLDAALDYTSQLVTESVAMTDQFGVPARVGEKVLQGAAGLIARMDQIDPGAKQIRGRKADLLMAMADSASRLGKFEEQMKRAQEALALVTVETESVEQDLEALGARAEALMKVGAAHSVRRELDKALLRFNDALAIRIGGLAGAEKDAKWLAGLASAYQAIANAHSRRGEPDEALAAATKGLGAVERLAAIPGQEQLAAERRVSSLILIGDLQRQVKNYPAALDSAAKGLALVAAALEKSADAVPWLRRRASLHVVEGDVHRAAREYGLALGTYQRSLAVLEELARVDKENVSVAADAAFSRNKLAETFRALKDYARAEEAFRQSAAVLEVLRANPNNRSAARLLIHALDGVGDTNRLQGDYREMQETYERQLQVAREVFDADPTNRDSRLAVARAWLFLGDSHLNRQAVGKALAHYRHARDEARALAAIPGGTRLDDERLLAQALDKAGEAMMDGKDFAGAIAWFEDALAVRKRLGERPKAGRDGLLDHAFAVAKVAHAMFELPDPAAALALAGEALAMQRRHEADAGLADPRRRERAFTLELLGRAKLAMNDVSGALASFEETRPIREKLFAADPKAQSRRNLGEAHRLEGLARRAMRDCPAASAAMTQAREHYDRAIREEKNPEHTNWPERLASIDAALSALATECVAIGSTGAATPTPEP